jgi:hypothetical protein
MSKQVKTSDMPEDFQAAAKGLGILSTAVWRHSEPAALRNAFGLTILEDVRLCLVNMCDTGVENRVVLGTGPTAKMVYNVTRGQLQQLLQDKEDALRAEADALDKARAAVFV